MTFFCVLQREKTTLEGVALGVPKVQTGLAWNPKDLTHFVGPQNIGISYLYPTRLARTTWAMTRIIGYRNQHCTCGGIIQKDRHVILVCDTSDLALP